MRGHSGAYLETWVTFAGSGLGWRALILVLVDSCRSEASFKVVQAVPESHHASLEPLDTLSL